MSDAPCPAVSDADALHAWLAIARVPALTASTLLPALAAAGNARAFVDAPHAWLPPALAARVAAKIVAASRDEEQIAADAAWLHGAANRTLLVCTDDAYPSLLAAAPDAPVALWVQGDATALVAPQVAVVGSRRPTPTGRQIARDWSTRFAERGAVVTSGLAAGIDAAAHGGALDAPGGRTVAVCGTGPDLVYPEQNAELAARIAIHGAVVSEFPPGTPARPPNFPRRNRIISGLAVVTLVVEAASRSGSLITARLAGEQGREVCAVPGSVFNPLAAGCHALLKQGARLVETADEVLNALEFSSLFAASDATHANGREAAARREARAGALDKEYEMLLDALGFEPLDVDTLVDRTGFPAQIVSSMLLILELQGRVEIRAGRFCRVSTAARSTASGSAGTSAARQRAGKRQAAARGAVRYDSGQ
jgi:DNA processing protein